jgi:hypothetical protein
MAKALKNCEFLKENYRAFSKKLSIKSNELYPFLQNFQSYI